MSRASAGQRARGSASLDQLREEADVNHKEPRAKPWPEHTLWPLTPGGPPVTSHQAVRVLSL